MGKLLVILGIIIVVIGLLLMGGVRLPSLGLGKLPGDIAYKGRNTSFYFPVVTCLVISAVLTGIIWLISFLTKR
ncbi:MAG: DUF2905 domain-containing protein [Terriglobia bacterium]